MGLKQGKKPRSSSVFPALRWPMRDLPDAWAPRFATALVKPFSIPRYICVGACTDAQIAVMLMKCRWDSLGLASTLTVPGRLTAAPSRLQGDDQPERTESG